MRSVARRCSAPVRGTTSRFNRSPSRPRSKGGGSGCFGRPFDEGPEDGGEGGGGGTAPPLLPPELPRIPAAEPTLITLAPAPELPLPPAAAPTPLAAADPPPARPAAPAASDPTAAVPATTAVPVASRSPPVSAGEPPSTAEKSFGICQHSMRKIKDAPITSNASIAGEAEVATACASGIHRARYSCPRRSTGTAA